MKNTNYMDRMEQRMERGPLTLDQQIEILRGLGLNIPEAVFQELPAGASQEIGFAELLAIIGFGQFDFDTGIWTPSSDQIFSFDAEVFDVGRMYLNFFQGLQAISKDELCFSDVEQDDSLVNWDEPSGVLRVFYRLNGIPCRFDARFMGDWLDVTVQDAVNEQLEKQGIRKRFYATDGTQGNTLFFCTEEWAEKLEEATLCYLSYSGQYS